MDKHIARNATRTLAILLLSTLLSGCGLLFGGSDEAAPTSTAVPRTVVPTFTATPVVEQQAPTPEPTEEAAAAVIALEVEPVAAPAAVDTAEPDAAEAEVTPTPAATPGLKVEEDLVNVRLGPGTTYGLAGTVNSGETYAIVGRNAEGTWWQICCVNGKEVWVFGELTDEENEELAPLVENVPAPPAAVAEAQPPQPAQPEPAQPEPTAAPEAAPPPSADPCAGIGGDGCKFKLRGGPSFAGNGGGELKFQLHFIHSGIEGGQPQGSYFVWVEKDGQKLPISDGVRSVALQDQQGPQGKYNYEFKVGIDQIPGNNVAGNYAIWVLDGNGERDSQTFTFSVPDGQGEVWIQFDQG